MEYITTTLGNLVHQTAFFSLTWGNVVMIAVACFFLYLAIRHGFEPLLLVPIAFGMLLVNIYPDIMLHAEDASNGTGGLLYYFYKLDEWSILPSLIFLGVGDGRIDHRLWTVDRESKEFPSWSSSTVRYFCCIPWSNVHGILRQSSGSNLNYWRSRWTDIYLPRR